MNCGAMLIGGEKVCPVCRQPVGSSQANTGWQPPQPQSPPPGAQWQQRPIGPPPLGGGDKSLNVVWMIGVALALLVVLASVAGTIFFMKSRRAAVRNNNENYNRRVRVDATPADDESVPTPSSPGGRTAGRNAPVSGGILNAKATSLPKPPYPAVARAARASGTVIVQVTVDETGKVTEARAISGHPLLKAAAEQAARQARFTPTTLSGQPVKVKGVLTYNFAPEAE
jgi:TonB family protein